MFSDVGGPGFDAIKPRIFQIGFNKCGTRTFFDFFQKNGIKSVHYKRGELARKINENVTYRRPPLEGIDKWIGYTDMQEVKKSGVIEAIGHYRSLAAYYPRSYFILNTRNKERWIKSRLNHGTNQNYANRYRQGLGLTTIEETEEAWSKIWDQHHTDVPRFFRSTGQHFLQFDIEADTPDKISEFLAPDFQTDPALFGHQGKTTSEQPENDGPKQPEGAMSPYVVSSAPTNEPRASVSKAAEELGPKFTPHNDLVNFDETATNPPFKSAVVTAPTGASTGYVIVTCMQNEGAFALEWIAYHRSIGLNNFLVFSHGSTDGTAEILDRLQEKDIISHVRIDDWTGKSAWSFALDKAVLSPLVFNADWVIPLEVDEYVNIRTGNGTFDCLLDALPENVTNIAMTWRLFGSSGASSLSKKLLIDQFDKCAPSYLPKPHKAWGFKTATRNIGAYEGLSFHRPSNLSKDFLKELLWVNGSGQDISSARAKSGWRSDVKSIGYDLVQLNKYPVRSLDDFLIRCDQDRDAEGQPQIGADYWTRMDWNGCQERTIRRNIPRLRKELKKLLQDETLSELHKSAVSWRKQHALGLRKKEFADLASEVKNIELDDPERVLAVLKNDSGQS